jgi:DNA polymerase III epsilon subunit-like protein
MYLVFDTETTGLPLRWDAPISDVENWPRVVQIAWQRFDAHGKKTSAKCFTVFPEGFEIPVQAVKKHGITTAKARRTGVPIRKVLDIFTKELKKASVTVAHNHDYDVSVVGAECHRLKIKHDFHRKRQVCTMKESTDYCELPGRYGRFKWPTLTELHITLFGKTIKETHHAAKDTAVCAKCFFELKRQGVIHLPKRKRHL